MKNNEHLELNFLIRAFARHCSELDTIAKFEIEFGKQPTRKQLAYANLGKYLKDRRPRFKENHRVKRFLIERKRYEAECADIPIASLEWRMEQYQLLYQRAERRSLESGNPSRCMEILTLAAKDSAGFYNPKTQNINVDNRTVAVNMSDEDINKKLQTLLGKMGLSVPKMPIVTKGSLVINGESTEKEDDEQLDVDI